MAKRMIRHIPSWKLGLSWPKPELYGNSPNELNNPLWTTKNCILELNDFNVTHKLFVVPRVERSPPFLIWGI
jgi:hypothetical protein